MLQIYTLVSWLLPLLGLSEKASTPQIDAIHRSLEIGTNVFDRVRCLDDFDGLANS